MQKYGALLLLCGLWPLLAYSQTPERYVRVQVPLKHKSITELAALGIETDHGIYLPGRSFTTEMAASDLEKIKAAGFEVRVLVPDLQAWLEARSQRAATEARTAPCTPEGSVRQYPTPANYTYGSMGGYHTYTQLLQVLDDMAAKFPNLITVRKPISDTLTTHEGRPLWHVKISDNPNVRETDEKEVLYTALHHAREPNGLSQMLFFMWYLLENYERDAEVKALVDNLELYFIPCINPDGYVYNETTNPDGYGYWRKNRRDNGNDIYGVDLNRNYGYQWGYNNSGSSPNPQSDTYRGPSGFSEPETRMVRDFCLQHNFLFAQNYHTFSNLLIYPWSFSDSPADPKMIDYGALFVRENGYRPGTTSQTVGYPVNGSSDDWMYGIAGTFSFTPEVGLTGFWPDKSEIDNLNRENMWTNLATALCALRYGELTWKKQVTIDNLKFKVDYQLKRYGLLFGALAVSILPVTPNIEQVGSPKPFFLQPFQSDNGSFDVVLKPDTKLGEEVVFALALDNGYYIKADTVHMVYVGGATNQTAFVEAGNNMTYWDDDANVWGTTTEHFVSAPSSITDSPGDDYQPGTFAQLTLKTPVRIPANATGARLRFWGRWEMSEDNAYVQVLAEDDNGTTTPLCGLYTEPGTPDQAPNQPIYDGLRLQWTEERMGLSDFIGKSIRIRFVIYTGGPAIYDGFYFDDLRIEYVDPNTSAVVTLPLEQFQLEQNQPNPTNGTTLIRWEQHFPGQQVVLNVTDALGNPVWEQTLAASATNQALVDTRAWPAGVYFYRLRTADGQQSAIRKMQVVK